jgi:hypothetical protein
MQTVGIPKSGLCFECLPPCSNMELIDAQLQDLDTNWDPEAYKSGAIFLASLHCGPDEQKIAELTGYLPDEIRLRGDRLRANKLWFDNKVSIPGPVPEGDGRAASIALLMAVLCADGTIQRSDAEEPAGSQGAAADAGTERAADTDAKS